MVQIFLIRHGQTDWNLNKRLQGHTDIPLNEHGRKQATALKGILREYSLEAFFSSDLSRARETAELARWSNEIPLITSSGLRETTLGEAEGLFVEDLHLKFPDSFKRWLGTAKGQENEDFAFPGGETKLQHRERMQKTLVDLLDQHSYSRVGIVTHGGAMRRVFEVAKNFNEDYPRTFNTSVFELNYRKHEREFHYVRKIYSPD